MSLTAEQFEQRRHRLGASDIATVLGIEGRPGGKTRARLALEKRGVIEPKPVDSVGVRHGSFVEAFIRREFERATGLVVKDPDPVSLIHSEHDWLLATPDGWVIEGDFPPVPIELKAARSEGKTQEVADENGETRREFVVHWGPSGTDEFPPYYLVQCQTQLAVTGAPYMFGAVLIAGDELRWYRIPRSEPVIQHIIAEGVKFMELVNSSRDPEVECVDDAKVVWQFAKAPAIDVTDDAEFVDALQTRQASKRAIKALEQQIETAETLLRSRITEHEAAEIDGRPVATWKQTKRGTRQFRVTKHGEELT